MSEQAHTVPMQRMEASAPILADGEAAPLPPETTGKSSLVTYVYVYLHGNQLRFVNVLRIARETV